MYCVSKIIVIFILLLKLLCKVNSKESALSSAFEDVNRHLFELETRMFIKNYGVDLNTLTMLVLKGLNEKAMPYRLQNIIHDDKEVKMDSSALLTFDSMKTLGAFNNKLILTNEFYKPLQLFVFCRGANIRDIESLAFDVRARPGIKGLKLNFDFLDTDGDYVLGHYYIQLLDIIQYEYFLVSEKEFVKLLTFVWYSPGKCKKLNLVEVNKFNMRTAKWDRDKFTIQKLRDFHGCEVVFYNHSYSIQPDFSSNIPLELETHLNFNLFNFLKNPDGGTDVIFEKACYNAFDIAQTKPKNMAFGYFAKGAHHFTTRPVEFAPIRIAITPSGNYSEYEKLRMPFDDYVWGLIALTFIAAFTTIFILYHVPRIFRDFVIGSNVTTPLLNVAHIFFGIGMISLPRRNFARFLVMLFILYSLIIRTAWQGKMFEFMQKDIPKPEPQIVEEMIQQGYTFYMETGFEQKFPKSEIAMRAKITPMPLSPVGLIELIERMNVDMLDSNFQVALQLEIQTETELVRHSYGRFFKRIRDEILYVNICGMKFPRHHHFFGIFDLKSQQLFDGGIIPHIERGTHYGFKVNKRRTDVDFKYLYYDGPKVLTMAMLEPGFVIWAASLTLTLAAYIVEWLLVLRDYLVIRSVLQAFCRTRDENIKIDVILRIESETRDFEIELDAEDLEDVYGE